jgi:hypothetical protein
MKPGATTLGFAGASVLGFPNTNLSSRDAGYATALKGNSSFVG